MQFEQAALRTRGCFSLHSVEREESSEEVAPKRPQFVGIFYGRSLAITLATDSEGVTKTASTRVDSSEYLPSRDSASPNVISSGTRTEIRDAQTGPAPGKWISQSGASGYFTSHNCQTDAVWFFPALSSLAPNPDVTLSYIGQETRNGVAVQHIRSYAHHPGQTANSIQQRLSRTDFYLDATLLPTAITFNTHPDNNLRINIPVEIDFSNYQMVSGIAVPMHIQKYFQRTLMIDLTVTSVAFNTGINISNFTIN